MSIFYYPFERLIYLTIAVGAIGSLLVYMQAAHIPGGLPALIVETILGDEQLMNLLNQIDTRSSSPDFVNMLVRSMLSLTPVIWVSVLLSNMQFAQFIANKVKVNQRPTPDYTEMTLPGWLELCLAASFVASFLADGWLGIYFRGLIGLLIFAYFLLGLAAIHAISRLWKSWKFRIWGLSVLYFVLMLAPWMFFPIGIIGLLESRFGLRKRLLNQNTKTGGTKN